MTSISVAISLIPSETSRPWTYSLVHYMLCLEASAELLLGDCEQLAHSQAVNFHNVLFECHLKPDNFLPKQYHKMCTTLLKTLDRDQRDDTIESGISSFSS